MVVYHFPRSESCPYDHIESLLLLLNVVCSVEKKQVLKL